MKTTERKVPALRFPEFEEEWEVKKLGSIATFLTGYSFKGDDISENPQGVKLMRGANISEGYIEHSPNIDRYYSGDLEALGKYLVKTNDIVIGMDGSKVGKNVAIVDQIDNNSLLVQRVCRIRCVKDKSVLSFIYQPLISEPFIQYVDKVKTSSGIPHISLDHIKSYSIHFPSLPEQQKIADFLSATDKRLELLKEKKQGLEDYKRGAMQRIFSQELRFTRPDGSAYEDWEEKKLGEVAKFRRGSFPQPYGLAQWYDDEGEPFVQVADVDENLKLKEETQRRISELACEQSVFIPKGTVIITIQGSIGRVAITQYDAYIDRTLLLFEEFYYPIAKIFFAYVIQILFDKEKQKAPGAVIKTITKEVLSNFVILLPSLSEQTQIANFLSAIDIKIEKLSDQIEATENYKKGLLQQMFV